MESSIVLLILESILQSPERPHSEHEESYPALAQHLQKPHLCGHSADSHNLPRPKKPPRSKAPALASQSLRHNLLSVLLSRHPLSTSGLLSHVAHAVEQTVLGPRLSDAALALAAHKRCYNIENPDVVVRQLDRETAGVRCKRCLGHGVHALERVSQAVGVRGDVDDKSLRRQEERQHLVSERHD